MKFIRIFLLILIIIGIGLLFTQSYWVPKLVNKILEKEGTSTSSGVTIITPPQKTILPYGDVVLRVGKKAAFADSTLTLIRVFDDSRCPLGVTCIWAGTVKSEVQIVTGGNTSTTTIELGKSSDTEALKITLLSVDPYPKQGGSITSDAYEAKFSVLRKVLPSTTSHE